MSAAEFLMRDPALVMGMAACVWIVVTLLVMPVLFTNTHKVLRTNPNSVATSRGGHTACSVFFRTPRIGRPPLSKRIVALAASSSILFCAAGASGSPGAESDQATSSAQNRGVFKPPQNSSYDFLRKVSMGGKDPFEQLRYGLADTFPEHFGGLTISSDGSIVVLEVGQDARFEAAAQSLFVV